tara:strand:- start:261 stop:872 length:612 start_codon:yes stop_codon:yes gene_type:complete
MVFWWIPIDISQGPVAKTVFIHVPLAWCSMIAIVIVAISSIYYLFSKKIFWDNLAQSTAEVGVMFGVLALISGIIWAKPIWGVWWTGEAKLTTTLILILIYAAYILFRSLYTNSIQMKKIAAIIAVIGAIDSPIIYFAANLWQEAHPVTVIGPLSREESSFGADYGITLLISVIAFTLLFVVLTQLRYKVIKIDNLINLKDKL